jgi:hypothetical protein
MTQVLVGQMDSIKSDRKLNANHLNEIAAVDFSFDMNEEAIDTEMALA